MKTLRFLVALLLPWAFVARGQISGFGDAPVEITVGDGGEQRFEHGMAVAEKDVVIHYDATTIYCDYAQYNPGTHDVLLVGNIRIYRDGALFAGDRAIYNFDTKALQAQNFRGNTYPFFYQAETIRSLEGNAFQGIHVSLTTSDSPKPDFQVRARKVNIYPNDHVVLENVTLYIGQTPVFWVPYIYQSLDGDLGFNLSPGYSSQWGAFLLTRNGFPITDQIHGIVHLDLRSLRGLAVGLDAKGEYGPGRESSMLFQSYYIDDLQPSVNKTALKRLPIDSSRYRIHFEDRTFFKEDTYATVDVTKLSDYIYLRDFNPELYRTDPQPDNVIALTKRGEDFTLTGIARAQVNPFFDTTERLPEIVLDMKRQPLAGLPIYYESETSAARLARKFGGPLLVKTTSGDQTYLADDLDYSATRFDTFHQITMPQTLGGWLSIVPRAGVRGTYYNRSAESRQLDLAPNPATGFTIAESILQSDERGGVFRGVANAGAEVSFKLSKEWDQLQSRAWGLDGFRHVIQPFGDLSLARTSQTPNSILQFDRLNPSTQPPSIDFPQFNTLDSIPNWSIWRLGVRNRFQTRRDDETIEWLWSETYFDWNIEQPAYLNFPAEGAFSNVIHKVAWNPLPWVIFRLDCQLPILATGFTQVNSGASFRVNDSLSLLLSHRYLDNNRFFAPGSNVRVGAYYRVNDNWAMEVHEEYEMMDRPSQDVTPGLETQSYEIHRDLSSWVASLGFLMRRNSSATTGKNVNDFGVLLTFTLKDLPSVALPLGFDPSSSQSNK